MLTELLQEYQIILASGSPRRQQFFKDLNLSFKVAVPNVEEIYPEHLKKEEITDFLALLKADAFDNLQKNEILITSDTIVWHQDNAVGKPKDMDEAKNMLRSFSGNAHEVVSSVCIRVGKREKLINQVTKVFFKELSEKEIDYYITNYQPLDKAGAYGIQEWLGLIAITKIEGNFYNVMGLPVQLLYKTLIDMVK
ncbi:Maf family nucleotide pyrophosphatase [Aquimarina sp. ERC-38]|uniref:Maf family nucleotide pyrophosphatase n=1 Tax=Aquimarina sp. ERC-38 TaxID=2949996 RepID=UPI002246703F|nr:Maf family nucleotide pyrophosphatase [Aquimarina sp. ERC-38]UZO80063.1 Maf family nucleotide pyrophosphatase [Aquimarina sp. ERC-38]